MTRRYTIVLQPEPEEGGYSVSVPALPGCFTQGETVDQCVERAKEAIALYVETRDEAGEPIPEETEPPRTIVVDVAA